MGALQRPTKDMPPIIEHIRGRGAQGGRVKRVILEVIQISRIRIASFLNLDET